MAYINDDEVLNLERTRQNAVNDLRSKGIAIDTDATLNEAYEEYKSLNNSAGLLDGSAEIIRDDNITTLKAYCCGYMPNLKKIYFKNVAEPGNYQLNNSSLVEHIEMPNCTTLGNLTQTTNTNLLTLYLPKLTNLNMQDAFRYLKLTKLIVPKLTTYADNVFRYFSCPVTIMDFAVTTIPNPTSAQSATSFNTIKTLILRSNTVPALTSTSYLVNPNLKIYIKSDLVNSLKNDTNWGALPCMANADAVQALETSDYADERWFEDTEEFELNYIYKDY